MNSSEIESCIKKLVEKGSFVTGNGNCGGTSGWDLSAHEQSFRKLFKSLQTKRRGRVLVSGAGTHTRAIWPLLLEYFNDIAGVIDRDPQASHFMGVPLYSRDSYQPQAGDRIILSSFSFEDAMYAELQALYGESIQLVCLYNVESWELFCEEAAAIKNDWNSDFNHFLEAMGSKSQGSRLNATGFGFVIAYTYTFFVERSFPQIAVSDSERLHLKQLLDVCFHRQLQAIEKSMFGCKTVLIETYALGAHVIQPVIKVIETVLAAGYAKQVVVLVSDPKTKEFFDEHPMAPNVWILDWYLAPAVGYFLPEPEQGDLNALRDEKSRLNKRLEAIYDASEVENMRCYRIARLRAEWLEQLCDSLQPRCFINILDNRPVSASFYLTRHAKQIPVVQIQHGTLSSALGPFWADRVIGWKDPHSQFQYSTLKTYGQFQPTGNLYLAYVRTTIGKQTLCRPTRTNRTFLFIFQGPAYWHVGHKILANALEIIRDAIPQCSREWRFVIKLRIERGRQMLNDFFSALPIEQRERLTIQSPSKNSWSDYLTVDAVGLMASSAREEAAYFGLPLFSLEKKSAIEPNASFADHGMTARIENGCQLAEALHALPRLSEKITLQHNMESTVDELLMNGLKIEY